VQDAALPELAQLLQYTTIKAGQSWQYSHEQILYVSLGSSDFGTLTYFQLV
jgi:hypothetical protein